MFSFILTRTSCWMVWNTIAPIWYPCNTYSDIKASWSTLILALFLVLLLHMSYIIILHNPHCCFCSFRPVCCIFFVLYLDCFQFRYRYYCCHCSFVRFLWSQSNAKLLPIGHLLTHVSNICNNIKESPWWKFIFKCRMHTMAHWFCSSLYILRLIVQNGKNMSRI